MKKIYFVSTENGCNNFCTGCADNNHNKSKNGREINRIIETPVTTLEEDIISIVLQQEYTPNYSKSLHYD